MSAAPKLSAIVPCYGQAHLLSRTLESLLAQDVPLEILVVDDGSPNEGEVAAVCGRFGDRVACLRQENAGASAARNAGLRNTGGEFVYFLDGDDAIAPGGLAALRDALQAEPAWSGVACRTELADAEGRPSGMMLSPPPTGQWFTQLARQNSICVGSMLIRRAVLARTGGFDPALRSCEDWDLWLQIARTGAIFGLLPQAHFQYRIHAGGKSRSAIRAMRAAEEVLQRARRPDPRVRDPAPKLAAGADSSDLDECLAAVACVAFGRSLGTESIEEAATVFAERLLPLAKSPHLERHLDLVAREACVALGILPPRPGAAAEGSWHTLARLAGRYQDDQEALTLLGRLVRAVNGDGLTWRRNYRRLAGAFPVRQLLWLRRRLLGAGDPENG